jgi:ubiquinone/menaquinone biosynthesis C-methylase UbiE
MAEQYDTLFVPRLGGYEALHAMLLAMLPEPHGRAMRVLELSAGTGNLTRKLLERLPQSQVVGYDLSADVCMPAREKG